jgi:HK97 gp10 family phage protein
MIVGLEKFMSQMDNISAAKMEKAMQKAIHLVQEDAKTNVSVESGELRESIYTDVRQQDNSVIGTCFTNKEYASYVEFGTGQKGAANHAGISPGITPAYRLDPWWIHESKIDKELAEKYHWLKINTDEGVFYMCRGQPARPFLYPALKNNSDNIKKIFEDHIEDTLRKATK